MAKLFAVIGLLNLLFLHGLASSQDSPAQSSLDIAPVDCSLYFASMNHHELATAVTGSRAFQSLQETPLGKRLRRAMRRGRASGYEQFGDNPIAPLLQGYQETFDTASARLVWPFLEEALKNELFIFADKNYVQIARSFNQVYADMVDMASDDDQVDPAVLLQRFAERMDEIEIPQVVAGCVLDNPQNFRGLIETGVSFLDSMIDQAPPELDFLVDGYRIQKTETSFLITLTIDGAKLPDEIFEEMDLDEETVGILREAMGKKQVRISAGIVDNLMLVGIGPADSDIESLKKGEKLVDHPRWSEVRKLISEGQKPLLLAWYTAEVVQTGQSLQTTSEIMKSMMKIMLDEEAAGHPRNKELMDDVGQDLDALTRDVEKYLQDPADSLTFAFMTSLGIEGISQVWSVSPYVDSSRPMGLTSHIGEGPAMLLASRTCNSREQFATMNKWVDRGFFYAAEYVPDYLDEDDSMNRENYLEIVGEMQGIWTILSETTRNQFLPATENSEVAMAVDLSNSRTTWTPQMPDVGVHVSVPEFVMVMDCRDKAAMELAGRGYWNAARSAFAMFSRLAGPGIQDVNPDAGLEQFIAPNVMVENGNTRVTFDFPEPFAEGAGETFRPEMLLTDNLMLMSSQGNCERLLASHIPALFGPAGENVPAATIAFMDFRKCVDFGEQWRQYVVESMRREGIPFELDGQGESDLLDLNEEELQETINAGVDFLKCFHGFSARISVDDNLTSTHFQLRFQDKDSGISIESTGD